MATSPTRKAPTSLSVRVDRAKELGINIPELVDTALENAIRDAERARWADENRDAIDAYNERIANDGAFGDGRRGF